MSPLAFRGSVPARSCCTAASLGVPGARKKLLTKACVGVVTVRLPTFTTPVGPTMNPWGLANQTLPPMRPSWIELRIPCMSVRSSRTRLTRFAAAVGTCRLTTLPASTPKRENELNAFAPAIVAVVIWVRWPWTERLVAVRPSGTICCACAPPAERSAAHTAAAQGFGRSLRAAAHSERGGRGAPGLLTCPPLPDASDPRRRSSPYPSRAGAPRSRRRLVSLADVLARCCCSSFSGQMIPKK